MSKRIADANGADPIQQRAAGDANAVQDVGLIYAVIAILPFLIAIAAIVFIWWLIGMCLSGGFGIRK